MHQNILLSSIFSQLEVANRSIIEMAVLLDEDDLNWRYQDKKRSLGELLNHLSLLYRADYLIMEEASKDEMGDYYQSNPFRSTEDVIKTLQVNFEALKAAYYSFREDELEEMKISYWGTAYSRYEWLLEILGHMYHHRAQLHFYLEALGKSPQVRLFE
ncbi:DinB family protein [Metabacillus sp. KIGAM252]|uniref:DinB family protein n=1 Tax=Metabacillus flavus TaxID=2823519 RepID=A0ABS5LCH4_9BACI|nr:DinB family protein [Metabacillus flavus]MBS2968435.1 DinB family protein [Metabacillus flavus]